MPNILIVDDDAVVRSYLTAVLGRAGYEVLAVSSGKEALRRYQAYSPALVILDIVMPEMDGFETMQRLRQLNPSVKIIGISGMGTKYPSSYLEIGRRLGMNVTLEKPFSEATLVTAVGSCLDERPANS